MTMGVMATKEDGESRELRKLKEKVNVALLIDARAVENSVSGCRYARLYCYRHGPNCSDLLAASFALRPFSLKNASSLTIVLCLLSLISFHD
jgi:hypothetical protein